MLKTTLAASLAAIMLAVAPAAFAADQILALDRTLLIAKSAAGKSIQTQIQTIAKSVDAELTPEAKGLETEFQAIQTLTKGMSPEQMTARADIKTRVESFGKRKNAFDLKRQKRGQELSATQAKAEEDFEKAAQPILSGIIKERGALLVVEKREIVFADEKIDITQVAITKMDAAVKSIPVTKVNLPDKPTGQ